jgi:hypothetical protein
MNFSQNFMQPELENIRSQLLNDLSPDDMCPIGAHLFGSPGKSVLSGSDDDVQHQEV